MTSRSSSIASLTAMNRASPGHHESFHDVYVIAEERNSGRTSPVRVGDGIMFTSLCAAFSNLDPIVPPVVRRHSSRWRVVLSVVIGIMTFSASFAHLRFLMQHGNDRRVEERHHPSSLRSLRLFRGNPVVVVPHSQEQLRTSTEKEEEPTNPRVLLGATITFWTIWGILVTTHPFVKRRTDDDAVSDGSETERAILTCVIFIFACLLTHWTRIRYGEAAAEAVK